MLLVVRRLAGGLAGLESAVASTPSTEAEAALDLAVRRLAGGLAGSESATASAPSTEAEAALDLAGA